MLRLKADLKYVVDTPEYVAKMLAGAINLLPNPRWTPDKVRRARARVRKRVC